MENSLSPQRQKQNLYMVWLMLTVMIPIYGMVAGQMVGNQPPNPDQASQVYVFGGIALMEGLAALFIRFGLCSENSLRQFAKASAPGSSGPNGVKKAIQRLFVFSIITWALNESIAIFGILAASTTGAASTAYPFIAAGFILNLISRPNIAALDALTGPVSSGAVSSGPSQKF